jgi:SAM-dependent methyltransferase
LRPNVKPFFFHAYDPSWEVPLDFGNKDFGMVYVGNNWFRWRSIERVLKTIEKVRARVGRLALVGNGWDKPAPWANSTLPEDAYRTDPAFLSRLGVETVPPVRFDQVIGWMGRGLFSPVVYRPLFDHLGLVTCRTYETPAANTIPLFCQDEQYVREIYGEVGIELVLPTQRPEEKIVDLLERPRHYLQVVREVRNELTRRYAYADRLKELIELVQG